MALLSNSIKQDIWAKFMRALSDRRDTIGGLNKSDLRAAVDATDQWINDNAASFNTALPLEARSAMSARQKAWLFMLVAGERFGVI